jgi:glycosyltransferase involved in cell wall biosynthesis
VRTDELRLVQIIPYLGFGGLERVATTLTLSLEPEVARIVVCSSGGEPYQSELRAAGVPVELVPRPWGRPVPLLRSAIALARVLRRERPHVVHAHNPAASAAAALARTFARARETAIVATYHGVVPRRLGRATHALALSADLVVGVSPSSTRALHAAGFPEARTHTIFNAVEPRASRGPDDVRREFRAEGIPLIVTVGRYFPEKNQALLLDALAALAQQGRRFRALVVGYGPLEDHLRRRARELGLENVAVVTGRRDDAADLIAAADVFALSSDSEALPLVVLEAMSLGTPVVATDPGGVRDVVADGETGLAVPVGDAGALAAGLARVLDDGTLRARLAESAAAFVHERCSVAAMTAGYRAAYAEAVRRRGSAR